MNTTNLPRLFRAIRLAAWLVITVLTGSLCAEPADLATEIRELAGFSGGLIVHVGCDGGRLTAALRANHRTIVHGLDDLVTDVAAARKHLRKIGVHGAVSVELWEGPQLPYADNMVNLLVVSQNVNLSRDEVLRVLCPRGQAVFLSPRSSPTGRPSLTRINKPWPTELDDWTHFLHDPGNNAVARDTAVGPPEGLQWMAGPAWGQEHDVTPSVFAPVSCNGRLFYILREGPTCTIDQRLPDRHWLVARDAFNGVLLWKQPVSDWYSNRIIWGHIPMHSQRRLVAVGDRVYVTLGIQAPVTALDAVTGEVIREYSDTARTSEIICSDGKLALVTRTTHPLDGVLARRDGTRFMQGYNGPQEGGDELIVVREDTGQCLWRSKRRCMPLTLAVTEDRVLFAEDREVVCLDLESGDPVWTAPCEAARTLVVHGNTVFAANAHPQLATLTAFDLLTGKQLWRRQAGSLPNFLFFFGPLDVYVARNLVWGLADDLQWNKRPGSGHLLGLDLRSGEIRRRIPLTGVFTAGHHVRCYKGKATEDYLLFNKRGIEFVGLVEDRPPVPNSYQWVRGTCRYGILPCNGLIYAPPHACSCYPGAKVDGFVALNAKRSWRVESNRDATPALQRGPAFGQSAPAPAGSSRSPASEWPTFRGDAQRSGRSPDSVPADLEVAWETKFDTQLSSPVVAGGKVLVAAVEDYTLHARDAEDGRAVWSYTVGGRIDSPPTIHKGRAIFGCRDGWVYCVQLDDGQLIWRFRAAPDARRVGAMGRLESAWPVHGSVLVKDHVAYFAAGRSSFLDGGLYVYGVDAATGEVRHQTRLAGPDPQANTRLLSERHMPGAVPDILVSDDTSLYMRHVKLDWQLSAPSPENLMWGVKNPTHLLTGSGFLDDTLFNRTVWHYGFRIDRSQMLAIDGMDVYGLRVYEGVSWNCPIHHIGDGHLIFRQNVSQPVPKARPQSVNQFHGLPVERYTWHARVPIRVSAMLLAGDPAERLFVAGVPDQLAPDDPPAYIEGRRGAKLLVLDAGTGEQTAQLELNAPPVWNGLAAAYGKLYLGTVDGKLLCLASPRNNHR